MPSEARVNVDAGTAQAVRDERLAVAAIEGRDVPPSAFVRLLLDMFRAFIGDPRAEDIMRRWRGQLGGRGHQDQAPEHSAAGKAARDAQ